MTLEARCSQTVIAVAAFSAIAATPAGARIHFRGDAESRPRGEARPAAGLIVEFRRNGRDADRRRAIGDAGGRWREQD
jgi:hypothetical protein